MTLKQLFDNPIFKFPLRSSNDFASSVSVYLDEFKILIKSVNDEHALLIDEEYEQISKTCEEVESIIKYFFQGKLIDSYSLLNQMLERIEPLIKEDRFKSIKDIEEAHFYRARICNENSLSEHNMFHIPFERRTQVRPSRFSIAGLPCLYLSNSIYTCWEELNRPEFSKLFVSRFYIKEPGNFLKLIPNYEWYRQVLLDLEEQVKSENYLDAMRHSIRVWLKRSLCMYPIYLTCYMNVSNKDASFTPEYIMPQLLMQWIVKQEQYDGIKYLSTKAHACGSWRNQFINYAIPVKEIKANGYCSIISSKFKSTTPISWEISKITNPSHDYTSLEPDDFWTSIIDEYMVNQSIYKYSTSAFKLLEYEIASMPKKELTIIDNN